MIKIPPLDKANQLEATLAILHEVLWIVESFKGAYPYIFKEKLVICQEWV